VRKQGCGIGLDVSV